MVQNAMNDETEKERKRTECEFYSQSNYHFWCDYFQLNLSRFNYPNLIYLIKVFQLKRRF